MSNAKHKTILGMHPTITKESLKEFISLNGSSHNVVSMALNRNQPNVRAYESERKKIEAIGHIQMDFGEFDFLQQKIEGEKKFKKLASFGGALYFAIWVDELSGMPFGKLLKSTKDPIDTVKHAISGFKRDGHNIKARDIFTLDKRVYNRHRNKFNSYVAGYDSESL